ncbi:hypothetical protein G3I20_02845 [Streptomyces sp. SID8111]|uniref:NACHT domain-containing protein n=1 Tax=Streptomyces sp. SID8111 TaxID=2706100 RepID=UPI0013C0AEAB|nr:hypothetical protein [Streptomyces sp. SID8111]NEC25535.1 hypothetical protein [Streptomyces sp. SID8111]
MKFDLYRLGTREFENLTQAIAVAELGPDVAVYGVGSDGGREATQNEVSGSGPYILLQAKYKETATSSQSEATWLIKELRKEFKEWKESEKRKNKPDQFILATNVTLSATPRTGGLDRVMNVMKEECAALGISKCIVWHSENINRFLEKHSGIRTSYAAWILPGDILSLIYSDMTRHSADAARAIRLYTAKELLEDRYANLDQAGSADDRTVSLADVFFDVPIGVSPERYATASGARCLETLIAACNQRHNPAQQSESPDHGPALNRFVLVGGPGQGKSTVSQFLCQLYRAQLVKDTASMRNSETKAAVTQINQQAIKEELTLKARRWPINIPLTRLADELAQGKCHNLLDYIAQRISEASTVQLAANDMRDWLEKFPWLVVLDGLDEVPGSSNRSQVMSQVTAFQLEADELNADVVIVATTRPQGYTEEFSPKNYVHYYLTALDTASALAYGKKLADARHGSSSDRVNRLMARLNRAAGEPSTAHLMTTPLQVTIMAVLLDRVGKAPKDRFTLFADYYRVIFERELEKEGAANNLLRDHKIDIDSIHADVGLLLQTRSERSGETESRITVEELDGIIRDRLISEGHDGAELDGLTSSISRAATHRLVFLVPSRDGEVSFEIRSLQEFWAADALMNCSEEEIGRRLRIMSVSSHWRNVLLFALGNIFATRRNNLRDSVVALVAELNAHSEDFGTIPRRILTGSRLAVEILNDGMVRAPRYEAVLVEESLKLLALPYSEHIPMLAGCISERGVAIARDQINVTVQSRRKLNNSTLAFLGGRAAQGDQWALDHIVGAFEQSDAKEKEAMFRASLAHEVPCLLHVTAQSLVDSSLTISLALAAGILSASHYSALLDPKGCSAPPNWFPSLVELFGHSSTALEHRRRMRIRVGPVMAHFCAVGHQPAGLAECLDGGFPSDHWLADIAAFCSSPTKENLAEVVRNLGPYSEEYKNVAPRFPWIIYYGIQLYREVGDEAQCMIRNGYLGDTHDWLAAEGQWSATREAEVVTSDFNAWASRRADFMPLPACQLAVVRNPAPHVLSLQEALNTLEEVVSTLTHLGDEEQRTRVAGAFFRVVTSMQTLVPPEVLEAALRKLHAIQRFGENKFANLAWLSELPENHDWSELVDWVGRDLILGHAWIPYPLPIDPLNAWTEDFSRIGLARIALSHGRAPTWDHRTAQRVLLEWDSVKYCDGAGEPVWRVICIVASVISPPRDSGDAAARVKGLLAAYSAGEVAMDFLANAIALDSGEASTQLLLGLVDNTDPDEFSRQDLYERMVQLQSTAETGIEYQMMRPA